MRIKSFNITNALGFNEGVVKKNEESGATYKVAIFDPQFNLIIGKNDSGKSSVAKALILNLIFIKKWLEQISNVPTGEIRIKIEPNSQYHMGDNKAFDFEYYFFNKGLGYINLELSLIITLEEAAQILGEKHTLMTDVEVKIEAVFQRLPTKNYDFLINKVSFFSPSSHKNLLLDHSLLKKDFSSHEGWLTLKNFSEVIKPIISEVLYISPDRKIDRSFYRKISDTTETRVLDRLRELKEGTASQYQSFINYQSFIFDLIKDGAKENRRIVFPLDKEGVLNISISNDKEVLPLSSYGSGIEQLAILAAFIVLYGSNHLIIIEEPENHFHPDLQRKFFRYIREMNKSQSSLDHQYLIISHSSVFINEMIESNGKIYRSEKINPNTNQTALSEVSSLGIYDAIDDLGIKGSDLYQSNGIIWVEGPSDKIYIKKWLQLYCEKNGFDCPRENIDYSFSFYGGTILSHFSAVIVNERVAKDETNDFINILKINKNVIVVVDQDGDKAKIKNKTKAEIEKELSTFSKTSMFWSTEGYEIENYLSATNIAKCAEVHSEMNKNYKIKASVPFNSCFTPKNSNKYTAFKNKGKATFAKLMTTDCAYEDFFSEQTDLEHKIKSVYETIQKWIK